MHPSPAGPIGLPHGALSTVRITAITMRMDDES